MYGAVAFYKAAVAAGIRPIIGCEVYVAPRGMTDRVHGVDDAYTHLVLLCRDETGYHNLCYLVSAAFERGFYGKPRIDWPLLRAHAEGLICLSGCVAGTFRARSCAAITRLPRRAPWSCRRCSARGTSTSSCKTTA